MLLKTCCVRGTKPLGSNGGDRRFKLCAGLNAAAGFVSNCGNAHLDLLCEVPSASAGQKQPGRQTRALSAVQLGGRAADSSERVEPARARAKSVDPAERVVTATDAARDR